MALKAESVSKGYRICSDGLELTDKDLLAVEKMAEEQINYVHPLKNGKADGINKKGKHNMNVLLALRALKKAIESGYDVDFNDKKSKKKKIIE